MLKSNMTSDSKKGLHIGYNVVSKHIQLSFLNPRAIIGATPHLRELRIMVMHKMVGGSY